jgi:hypothetical protein
VNAPFPMNEQLAREYSACREKLAS